MTPEEYARSLDVPVAEVVREAAARVPVFAERLRAAGSDAAEVGGVDGLDRLPVLAKDDLIAVQAADPPFGGLVADLGRLRRVFQSPGPLYEPEFDEPDPWRWRPALEAAGFGPDDVVLNCFGYHLSPAGVMFEAAALALGCTVVPGGVGNRDLQARLCRDVGVTAYIGLPSYLKALLEEAGWEGASPSDWRLRRAFVSAEPLPPSLRDWLRQRVPTVLQGYGTAEAGNLGYECERMDGLHVPEDVLVTVCDLDSGAARWDDEPGQVVVTLLRADHPLVRFGTGDLSAWIPGSCPCGRPTPRLAGFLGRVGDAVKVRGMFLHPRQAQEAMQGLASVAGYRFVVDRAEHRDLLRCEVVPAPGADQPQIEREVRDRIRSALRFDAEVRIVEQLDGDGPVIEDVRDWT